MIVVLFNCKKCGLKKAKAFVRDRLTHEELRSWMEEAMDRAMDAHSLLSPSCRPKTLKLALMVPNHSPEGLGFPIREKVKR